MLEVRVYHREDYNYTGQLPTDKYGNDFDTVFNNTKPCNYLTFDGKGINLLDESLKFYEDDDFIGYTLPCLSNVNCEIEADYNKSSLSLNLAPSLDAYPKKLTIQFYNACCKEIKIIYCNENGIAVTDEIVSVKGNFVTHTFLRGYYRIYVQFTKTAEPYQYVRIESIIYGSINVFNKFTSHNLIEEINVLSDDLPINQFEATIVNPNHIEFAKKDPLVVFSNNKYYGSFYIVNSQRIAKNIYDIKAQNSVFILDNTNYKNWDGGAGINYITEKIFDYSGVSIKSYDNTLLINGDFKEPSCRMILAGIGFSIGAMVDSSRSDEISLIPIPTNISSTILTKDRRIIGDNVLSLGDEISKATIEYVLPTTVLESEKTVTVTVELNQKTVYKFDNPVNVTNVSDSTVLFKDMYSVEFIPQKSSVTITYFEKVNTTYYETVLNNNAVIVKEKEFKKLKVCGNYLEAVGNSYIMRIISRADDVQKYIQSRGKVNAKIRLRNEHVGDLIQIETAWDGIITGIITKMNITFGYEDIADIEVLEWNL